MLAVSQASKIHKDCASDLDAGCNWSRNRGKKALANALGAWLVSHRPLAIVRCGESQIRKQILLKNSKGEGKTARAPPRSEGLSREGHQYRCRSVISIGPRQHVTAV